MGKGGTIFRQSLHDFPCPVVLGRNLPSFGLHRYRQGLRFLPLDDEGFTLRGDRRQLLYKGRRRSHRFTILDDTSFEYDCILNKEPDNNVISLLIEGAEYFDFFRQPDFVKNPFLKGSYAVYKKNTFVGEGTGKLCHIHRPLIIDALGRRVWGELAVAGKTLRITIPEQWLSMAKYPVVVDPTIGTTTVGSQNCLPDDEDEQLCFEYLYAVNRFLVPVTINGICTAYYYCYEGHGDAGGYPVLFSDNANKPKDFISNDPDWFSLNPPPYTELWLHGDFTTKLPIAAGSYIWFGVSTEAIWYPLYDYGAQCYYDSCWNFRTSSFPATAKIYNMKLSMYFTYNSSNNFSRKIRQTVYNNDSRKNNFDYKRTITQTIKGADFLGRFETFVRQCVSNVTNSDFADKTVFILRTIIQHIDIHDVFINSREIINKIIDTVQAGDLIQRVQGLCRELGDSVSSGDTVLYPVLFVRSVNDTAMGTDFFCNLGAFVRGLADTADNTAETDHEGDFYRKETETVQVEGIAIRGLLFFVRIVSQVFFRDYLLRRFLIAREELKLKSCISREIVLDSKID